VTSQNHGYALDAAHACRPTLTAWFLNANDGSVEGIRHRHKPWSAVQFHPEAACGPVDTGFLFDRFLAQVAERKRGTR
jgi:carbamoyl-phosphate synthase small subunit